MPTPRRLSVVLGAVALSAHPAFAAGRTWTVEPEGVTFEMSPSDVRAWRGAASGPPVFAVSALLAAEKRRFDADAKERARELANSERPQMGDNTMDDSTTFEVLSIVGPLVSYRHSSYGYTPGTAHPTGFNVVQVVDVSRKEAPASLLDFYAEGTIVTALKADPWIRRFANPEKGFERARSLEDLLEALDPQWAQENAAGDDHDCAVDVSFDAGIFKAFSFHHVAKGRVAVRIEVPPGTEWCNRAGGPQPIGLLLPIPDALRAHLAKAGKGEAGFLTANVKAESRTYSEHWEVDLLKPDAQR